MMELSHSLTLNEEVLKQIPEAKRPVFVFEWLRFLDKVLVAAQKSDIKGCQKKLVEQLTNQINESPGPPTRNLIARCLSILFSVGDTFLLFETINKCNDILRNKDDSPSYLPTRLCATTCIGFMYERLGRMMGRSYEETVQILLKPLKNAESQVRCEIMMTLEKVCCGMGTAASSVHKDIYKAARHCMTDRVMAVRCAASKCLLEMLKHAPFLYTLELESLASLCFRSFDGSNYDVRCSVGKLLGMLMATTQQASKTPVGKNRMVSVDEVLVILSNGFLRGGSGFLKGGPGDMIKGSSNVIREVRVGVTHGYVEFVQAMGGAWLEHNLSVVLGHILDLVANPKASPTHVDAVYSRKCVSFILLSVLGRMLGEKAQIAACKELCQIVIKHMNSLEVTAESATVREGAQDMYTSQHVLVCALQEMGCLVQSLGTTATILITEPNSGILEPIMSVLVHPMPASRLAAAWCLRCICLALPSQLTPLIDRCLNQLEAFKSSPETIGGCSVALAALVGVTHKCPLGIPYARGKMIFNIAEDLLRSASQNSRLSLHRTHAGWLLIGSLMTLGPSVVRGLLPRMMLLWRNAFPRSSKELESEKARGDAFTWQVTLEGRAGALSAMYSFLAHCNEMVTEDVVRRLLTPIESALSMIANISGLIKTYGQHLKASGAMVRLRLYETLSKLPPHSLEGSYNVLLRLLVAEFTLAENPANTTTSLLRAMCHTDDSVILGSWLQETDHKSIEDQLQPNSASGSGALEHDSTTLYKPLSPGEVMPGPLPLGVAVIDMSVVLFGSIFPHVAYKHRYQMLDHFSECLKQTKAARQEAVQINIFTAVLSGLKSLADSKTSFGEDDVRRAAINLVMGALTNSNPILRCAAGEALGRMSQVISDSRFTAEMAQSSFDRLKSARDVISRTGHSLALGCIHRYVGGMGSGQHLNTSVSILLALAQDTSSPVVQVWALHALALIADSGGPMFRSYVEPTLSLTLKLLLNVRLANVDVYQCIGKCLSALITAIGPELQGNTNSISTARSSFLCAFAIMQDHYSPLVQAEATACLQQLHMFAPRHVNLSSLVPNLCRTLNSSHLLLRRAAVSCLRQLAQREACEVCEHAITLARESMSKDGSVEGLIVTEMGLPGILFGMLDMETDAKLVSDIHDTLTSMLQALAEENLGQWLRLCKDVLTTSTDPGSNSEKDSELDAGENDADDEEHFRASEEQSSHPAVAPRWPTRVFAAESVRRIISVCEGNRMHFDISLAKEMQINRSKVCDYLVFHLSDLVRMAFIAATSDSDQLRLEGLKTLQVIIDKFAKVPEPEFPGHVILEQFQAQVGAALRPAFSPETPSHVTAMACQVCSAWIGSGVARDLNDLRRVHQLLVSSLTKLKKSSPAAQLYNESAASLEKLAILKAWAEVYVVAMGTDSVSEVEPQDFNTRDEEGEFQSNLMLATPKENLLDLVSPELVSLSKHWLAALKDHALLSLPAEFSSQLPHDGGAFYSADTIDAARPHYRTSWPSILHAAALWLTSGGFNNVANEQKEFGNDAYTLSSAGFGAVYGRNVKTPEDINADRFYLVFGICIEALCSSRSTEPLEHIMICLHALEKLLSSELARSYIGDEQSLGIELANVIHRLLMMRESVDTQLLMMRIIKLVLKAAQEKLDSDKKRKLKEMVPANQDQKEPTMEIALLGEGKTGGQIEPGKSVVFSVLEVCLCLLVRNLPHVNLTLSSSMSSYSMHRQFPNAVLTEEASSLVATAISILADIPPLCSPAGSVAVLPTILHLVTSVLQEATQKLDYTRGSSTVLVNVLVQCLHSLVTSPFNHDERCKDAWEQLMRSALLKILEINKSEGDSDTANDVDTIMMSVAVFVLGASKNIVCVPALQNKCVQLFCQAFQSQQLSVRLKCVQLLKSIYQLPDSEVSTPYIRAISPNIIEYALSTEAKCPMSDAHFLFTLECLQIAEILSYKKSDLLALVVPLLIQYLNNSTEYTRSQNVQMLHDHVLKSLMKIGPQFPQQFRGVMLKSPDLRIKLETAVRANQNSNKPKTSSVGSILEERENRPPPAPSIKLKTDFSNFTG